MRPGAWREDGDHQGWVRQRHAWSDGDLRALGVALSVASSALVVIIFGWAVS